MQTPWSMSVNQLAGLLKVDTKHGLTQKEANRRLRENGLNLINKRQKNLKLRILINQILNPMVYVLLLASLIALMLKEYLDLVAILSIVVFNCLVGFFQEYKAEKSIDALSMIFTPKARVMRGGKIFEIETTNIVVGDILILEAGDLISADARVISAHQLSVDESILTGESFPVQKSEEEIKEDTELTERSCMIFASTSISQGSCKAIVCETGNRTEVGKIAEMLNESSSDKTPLEVRLEKLGKKLIISGILILILVIVIGVFQKRPWIELVMFALSLSVAVLPESLPTVVTIALVLAVHRMAKKKAIIRRVASVETLGSVDIICTDKTGTLTTGKMEVRDFYINPSVNENFFWEALVICNNASLESGGSGDATELALLRFAVQKGVEKEDLQDSKPRAYEWSFDSDRKMMSVAVLDRVRHTIITKGAYESIAQRSELTPNDKKMIEEKIMHHSSQGMRVLSFAYKNLSEDATLNQGHEEIETKLTFMGYVAISDPPRPESKEAVEKCHKSGIRVIMMTGDHPMTASSIAYELGIVATPTERAITGKELNELNQAGLENVLESVNVYARLSPENKYQLIQGLRQKGKIVAMTGDGVNDAPALKFASIGISMGKSGTEVARQASSIILTDDNFATVVNAIEEGRAVYGNIRRTLQYLLSTNVAELIFIFFPIIFGWPMVFYPVTLLWINLVTDGFPALALASEKVPTNYLEESSRAAGSFFDTGFMGELIFVGASISGVGIFIYKYALENFPLEVARSMGFSYVVFSVLFRSLSSRSETKTFFQMPLDYKLILAISIPFFIQLGLPRFDFLLRIFKIQPLNLNQTIVIFLLSLLPVTCLELTKLWRRK